MPVLNSNSNSSLFHKHLSTSAGSCVHSMLLEQDTHYLFITRLLGHHPKEEKNDFLFPHLVCSLSDHKLKESDLSLHVKSDTQAASPVNAVQNFCLIVVSSPGSDLYFCPNNNGWLICSWALTLPLFRCGSHILFVDASLSRSRQRRSNL